MKLFKRSDVLVITVLLLVSLVSWALFDHFSKDRAVKAEIYYYSELVQTLSLDGRTAQSFSIAQNPNVVLRLDGEGGIAFIASDCPDQVCVHTGTIHRSGQFAACLPNGILVKIVPEGEHREDDTDIVAGG